MGNTRIRIVIWTRQARSEVMGRLTSQLPPDLHHHVDGIMSIIDELAKNAIKANHKHVLIRDRIRSVLETEGVSLDEIEERIEMICESMHDFNEFTKAHPGLLDGISPELSKVLRAEQVWIELRNRDLRNSSQLSEEEIEKLRATDAYASIYQKLVRKEIYVEIRIKRTGDLIWIEIINSAPILESDLVRLQKKREAFAEHRANGTEHEFFISAMDTSEGGAGFGYATIDTQLANMGLDPFESLYVISMHSTNAMLKLDLNRMRRETQTSA